MRLLEAAEPDNTGSEKIGFYSVCQDGSIKVPELFQMFDRVVLAWWPKFTGMTRDEYWAKVNHYVIARYTRVSRFLSAGSLGDVVNTRVVTLGGRRKKKDGGFEYGGIDQFEAFRPSDGAVVAELVLAWVWVDASGPVPKVATVAPRGLERVQNDLPPVAEAPAATDATSVGKFTWSLRETDPNRHVSFLSYFERAENALADGKSDRSMPSTWEAWFRRESLVGEKMNILFDTDGDGRQIVVLAGDTDDRRRVVLRHSSVKPERRT